MKKLIGYILCLGCVLSLSAQDRVYLEHSDVLAFDEQRLPDAQILRGDVQFRHEDMLMYCDSAYFYEKTNSVTAFGHIRFVQGDTLFGYGKRLYYDGNTRLARLCREVRLEHRTTILTTDSLNYDRNANLAYYFTGGTIRDSLNSLQSVWGEYNPSSSEAVFRREVHLQNDNFTLDTDTLHYNTQTHLAHLVCPTTIVYEQETTITSANGWYNTSTEQSVLYDQSLIAHQDGKQLTGDTIFYDKKVGYGELRRHMEIRDTVQKVSLFGHYGQMWEKDKRGMATDSAMLVSWAEAEPTYMHADTLFTEEVPYTDSLGKDTTFRQFRAFHHVRAYSKNYQMVCDSVSFNGRDSIMVLHHLPICWSDSSQVSADSITVYFRNDKVDHIHGVGATMGVRRVNDFYFDQIAGNQMTAWVVDDEVKRVDVSGDAETIFYPKENDGSLIGVNTTQSSDIQLFFENQKIHHILFTTATTGVLYPLSDLSLREQRLSGFFWAEVERPMSKEDIFRTPPRTERPTQSAVSASEEDDTNLLKRL